MAHGSKISTGCAFGKQNFQSSEVKTVNKLSRPVTPKTSSLFVPACVHLIAQLFTFDARCASNNEAITIAWLRHLQCVQMENLNVVNCQRLVKHGINWYYSTLTVLARRTQRVFFHQMKAKVGTWNARRLSSFHLFSTLSFSVSCTMHCTFCYVKLSRNIKLNKFAYRLRYLCRRDYDCRTDLRANDYLLQFRSARRKGLMFRE